MWSLLENPHFQQSCNTYPFLLITKITLLDLLYKGSSNQTFIHIEFSIVSWKIYLYLQTGGNKGVTLVVAFAMMFFLQATRITILEKRSTTTETHSLPHLVEGRPHT
jgi:hypothetical protein